MSKSFRHLEKKITYGEQVWTAYFHAVFDNEVREYTVLSRCSQVACQFTWFCFALLLHNKICKITIFHPHPQIKSCSLSAVP